MASHRSSRPVGALQSRFLGRQISIPQANAFALTVRHPRGLPALENGAAAQESDRQPWAVCLSEPASGTLSPRSGSASALPRFRANSPDESGLPALAPGPALPPRSAERIPVGLVIGTFSRESCLSGSRALRLLRRAHSRSLRSADRDTARYRRTLAWD